MSKKSIFHRNYRQLVLPGVTLGVDVSSDGGRIAVALCRLDDTYSRDTGRYIVNTLFDENDQTLRAAQFTRNVFSIPYLRGFSGTEVIQPLLDFIGDFLNERAVYRVLRELFTYGATTKERAEKKAKEFNNPQILTLFTKVVGELDKRDIEYFSKVRTLAQFDRHFFIWQGSADAILNGVKTFSRLMYEEMELESEIKAVARLLVDGKATASPESDKEKVSEEQIKEWEDTLKRLTTALVKTKKVTGAALRKKTPVEKTAKPVKELPRTSSAPVVVAPGLDVLDVIDGLNKDVPPPLPEESPVVTVEESGDGATPPETARPPIEELMDKAVALPED